jgi:hypothetical protein
LTEEERDVLDILIQGPMSFKTISYEHDRIIFDQLMPKGLACATSTAYEATPAGREALASTPEIASTPIQAADVNEEEGEK